MKSCAAAARYVLVLLTCLCIALEIFFHYSICISSGLWSSWEHAISIHCGVPATVTWMPFRSHFSNQRYTKCMYLYCSCVFLLHLKSYNLFDMNKFRIMNQLRICNSHSLWSSSYCHTDAILHSFFELTICQGYVLTLLMFFALLLKLFSLFDMNKFRIMNQLGICNQHLLWSSSYHHMDVILQSFFESTFFVIWYEQVQDYEAVGNMQSKFIVEFKLPLHGCHFAVIFWIDHMPKHMHS
jgi:hypothetical protein